MQLPSSLTPPQPMSFMLKWNISFHAHIRASCFFTVYTTLMFLVRISSVFTSPPSHTKWLIAYTVIKNHSSGIVIWNTSRPNQVTFCLCPSFLWSTSSCTFSYKCLFSCPTVTHSMWPYQVKRLYWFNYSLSHSLYSAHLFFFFHFSSTTANQD